MIDPVVLLYAGYIGGSSWDYGMDVVVDNAGTAYVTGNSFSGAPTLPVLIAPDTTFNQGLSDTFVVKVNASGAALVYAGYIGGNAQEEALGIAVDPDSPLPRRSGRGRQSLVVEWSFPFLDQFRPQEHRPRLPFLGRGPIGPQQDFR